MANDVDDLHWMSGCWALDRQEHGSGENWMQLAGGLMLGVSRVVSNGETVAFEYLRIVTDDGSIALIASDATVAGVSRLQKKLPDCRIHYRSRSEFTALIKESGLELAANKRSIITNPVIEKAVRVSLEKPDGNLTKEDLEKVMSLNLAHTQVTDAGLKELVNLRQLKALQLQDTQVTNAGVVELQKALPKCKITHNAKE